MQNTEDFTTKAYWEFSEQLFAQGKTPPHMLKRNRKWIVVHGELDEYGNLDPCDQTDHPTRKAALESISEWKNVTRYRRGESWIYKGESTCGQFKLACSIEKNHFLND